MHQRAGEVARNYHEAESQGVGGVDEVRLSSAAGAKRVHRTPDARSSKVAETEDGHVVEGRAVPSHWDSFQRR